MPCGSFRTIRSDFRVPLPPDPLQGATFYRIIDRFIDQGGTNTDSIYGGPFKDDPGGLLLKHNRKVWHRYM
jgi:hypothetical protein